MAGIEKVCELGGEYRGRLMYGYKHNSLQVNPECRKLFRGHKAVWFLFAPTMLVSDKSYLGYKVRSRSSVEIRQLKGGKYEWRFCPKNGSFDDENSENYAKPTYFFEGRPKFFYHCDYCVYVPTLQGTVEGKFFNGSCDLDIVKRKLNRMFRYKLPVVKLDCTISDEEKIDFDHYFNTVWAKP